MIAINGNILENVYTTDQWANISSPLGARVWGHEVDSSGNPIGSKMGDGSHLWDELKYWYFGGVPVVYNLPANSETPIIIDFVNSTIKIGSASPVSIGSDLSNYQKYPDIKFKVIIDSTNTKPIGNEGWITNEEWTDDTYTSLSSLTIQPDTDTGLPGGLTLDNINIIIKP